jgi:ArsR family transcriptional regulator
MSLPAVPLAYPDPTVIDITAGFHALSDPLRICVLELLRSQELCVCDLCSQLHVNQSKLSFHLKTLKDAGLVLMRQEGRWVYYRLNVPQLTALECYLATYRQHAKHISAQACQDSLEGGYL